MIFKQENSGGRYKFHARRNSLKWFLLLFSLLIFPIICTAQSSDQNFPTPVTTNVISGTIKARDIGDARLSNYFYTFNGIQGDIFINVQTGNFNGDIDVFIANGLKPLTKIVVYADASDNETGRVVYLRKPEKLLLRIEGRSPNDDNATFNIKFAGSFVAITEDEKTAAPDAPVVSSANDSDIIVNSVGTIIGVKPKPPIPVKEETSKNQDEKKSDEETAADNSEPKTVAETVAPKNKPKKEVKKPEKPPENNSDEPPKPKAEPKKEDTASKKVPKKSAVKKDQPETAENDPPSEPEKPAKEAKKPKTPKAAPKTEESSEAAALANINLKIIFKDGTKIERPMSEVLKVGVDKTTLTVITKDGKIGRYSIFDVEKFTIE